MHNDIPVINPSLRLCLIAILGEQNAQRVLELVQKLGDDEQELVILFITELINAKEEILNAQEQIDYL